MFFFNQIDVSQCDAIANSVEQLGFDFDLRGGVITRQERDIDVHGLDSCQDMDYQDSLSEVFPQTHLLCNAASVDALQSYMLADSAGDDLRKRNKCVYKQLQECGGQRELHLLPATWRNELECIERDYPNFAQLFRHIRAMGSLAELDKGVIQLEPILLDGAAGSGKSTLVEILAPIIAGGFVRLSMSAAETGAQIGGSASTWSNSQAGLVFNTLVLGKYANPLILLDEIDKATVGNSERFSPLGPLYELLEPAMAKHFKDLSLPALEIDASKIMWFATSNDALLIPHPLRQRMQEFEIGYPSAEDAVRVVESVFRRLKDTEPALHRFTLGQDVLTKLATQPARTVRAHIRVACGCAIQCSRTTVTLDDLPATAAQRARIGFCT